MERSGEDRKGEERRLWSRSRLGSAVTVADSDAAARQRTAVPLIKPAERRARGETRGEAGGHVAAPAPGSHAAALLAGQGG